MKAEFLGQYGTILKILVNSTKPYNAVLVNPAMRNLGRP